MTIEQAIEKAIEGGYERTKRNYTPELGRFHVCEIVLDPLFWQALGKVLNWGRQNSTSSFSPNGTWNNEEIELMGYRLLDGVCSCCTGYETPDDVPAWQVYWHKLIDHLADGGTIESYFETL